MSDEEVDLNAMIQSDRRRRFDEKAKRRQQQRKQRREYRDSHRDYERRDRSRDDRRPQRRDDRRDQPERGERRRENRRAGNEFVIESYAISATGFVSDVSLEDILKLAKGKKIINIKAFFEREDGKPLEPGKDNSMSVIINFVSKDDANEFIKEYSDKMLDGKNPLVFQFRRGIVSRRPKRTQKQQSEGESDNSEKGKSEQEKNQEEK